MMLIAESAVDAETLMHTPLLRLHSVQFKLPPPPALAPESPAVAAMTQLSDGRVLTVPETADLDSALMRMKEGGVRLLFCVDEHSNLTGVITSYDIQGEKPVQFIASGRCLEPACRWLDVHVRDICTPILQWPTIDEQRLRMMSVAAVLHVMDHVDTTHLLVAAPCHAHWILCGLLSRAGIHRRLLKASTD